MKAQKIDSKNLFSLNTQKLGAYFLPSAFGFTFSILMLGLIFYTALTIFFIHPAEHKIKPSGKIMANFEVETPEPPAPPPIETTLEKIDTHDVPNIPDNAAEMAAKEGSDDSYLPITGRDAPALLKEEDAKAHLEEMKEVSADTHTDKKVEQFPPSTIEDSVAGLTEQTDFGALPVIRTTDNKTPFDVYKTPFTVKNDTQGVISLVMVDYGLSTTMSKKAVATLPPYISFVASPYADLLQEKISYARQYKHEIWLGIPFSGTNEDGVYIDAGQDALYGGLKPNANMDKLNSNMGKAMGYVGIASKVIPDMSGDNESLQMLLNSISARGLGVLQLQPKDTALKEAIGKTPYRFVQSTNWIDIIMTDGVIRSELAKLEKAALKDKYVVAAFNPSAMTFNTIAAWQKTLAAKNIELAPLSYTAYQSRVDKQQPNLSIKNEQH